MSEQIAPLHISTLRHVNLLVNIAFKISLQGSERVGSKSMFVLVLGLIWYFRVLIWDLLFLKIRFRFDWGQWRRFA